MVYRSFVNPALPSVDNISANRLYNRFDNRVERTADKHGCIVYTNIYVKPV